MNFKKLLSHLSIPLMGLSLTTQAQTPDPDGSPLTIAVGIYSTDRKDGDEQGVLTLLNYQGVEIDEDDGFAIRMLPVELKIEALELDNKDNRSRLYDAKFAVVTYSVRVDDGIGYLSVLPVRISNNNPSRSKEISIDTIGLEYQNTINNSNGTYVRLSGNISFLGWKSVDKNNVPDVYVAQTAYVDCLSVQCDKLGSRADMYHILYATAAITVGMELSPKSKLEATLGVSVDWSRSDTQEFDGYSTSVYAGYDDYGSYVSISHEPRYRVISERNYAVYTAEARLEFLHADRFFVGVVGTASAESDNYWEAFGNRARKTSGEVTGMGYFGVKF